jgi:ABC-type transporter lipoprotein component MlaA
LAHAGFACAASLCALVACCAPVPGPAANLTMADISPILTPLTYREMLGAKCGEPNMAVKTAFMSDLKAAGATDTLMTEAAAEAGRIEAAERDTPNEYVCTAELYESTEENADAAQKAWAELKNRKS